MHSHGISATHLTFLRKTKQNKTPRNLPFCLFAMHCVKCQVIMVAKSPICLMFYTNFNWIKTLEKWGSWSFKTPFTKIILSGLDIIMLKSKYTGKMWNWFYDGAVLSKFMGVFFPNIGSF